MKWEGYHDKDNSWVDESDLGYVSGTPRPKASTKY